METGQVGLNYKPSKPDSSGDQISWSPIETDHAWSPIETGLNWSPLETGAAWSQLETKRPRLQWSPKYFGLNWRPSSYFSISNFELLPSIWRPPLFGLCVVSKLIWRSKIRFLRPRFSVSNQALSCSVSSLYNLSWQK